MGKLERSSPCARSARFDGHLPEAGRLESSWCLVVFPGHSPRPCLGRADGSLLDPSLKFLMLKFLICATSHPQRGVVQAHRGLGSAAKHCKPPRHC